MNRIGGARQANAKANMRFSTVDSANMIVDLRNDTNSGGVPSVTSHSDKPLDCQPGQLISINSSNIRNLSGTNLQRK